MKKLFFAMSALAALSLLAPSSGVAQEYNEIGLFTTSTPTPTNEEACYTGSFPGFFECYLILLNPFNTTTTMAPIAVVGGYEVHLVLPAGFQITSTTLPPNSTNFTSPPTFFVSGLINVSGTQALLATLQIGTFSAGGEGLIYFEPVPTSPSIEGSLAITDAGDNFVISEAFPASDSLADPVFQINMGACTIVDSEDTAWGTVKSLYR